MQHPDENRCGRLGAKKRQKPIDVAQTRRATQQSRSGRPHTAQIVGVATALLFRLRSPFVPKASGSALPANRGGKARPHSTPRYGVRRTDRRTEIRLLAGIFFWIVPTGPKGNRLCRAENHRLVEVPTTRRLGWILLGSTGDSSLWQTKMSQNQPLRKRGGTQVVDNRQSCGRRAPVVQDGSRLFPHKTCGIIIGECVRMEPSRTLNQRRGPTTDFRFSPTI